MKRFERKILIALLLAVILPLIVSLWLANSAIDSAFKVGVNQQIFGTLNRSLDVYKNLFTAWKKNFNLKGELIANQFPKIWSSPDQEKEKQIKELASYEFLKKIEFIDDNNNKIILINNKIDKTFRTSEHEFPIKLNNNQNGTLKITYAVPWHFFYDHQHLGDITQTYHTLLSGWNFLKVRYRVVYLVLILVVIIFSFVLGLFFARQVTKRISLLSNAIYKIGKGNLDIEIKKQGNDEIGDLFEAFNAMVKELRENRNRIEYLQKISAWQDIARKLAHEIKNPLTPIQLAAQQLKSKYKGDDKSFAILLEHASEIIEEEVESLRRLTSEFSAFAKLPEVKLESVNLKKFFKECSQMFSYMELGKSKLIITEPTEDIYINIDTMLLRQVIENLIRNSFEAIGLEKEGKIEVHAENNIQNIFIHVKDNGQGISNDIKDKIFEPYFTTKSHGTGLGLAIVKKIILDHNGEINVRSEIGQGADFIIELEVNNAKEIIHKQL